MIKNIFNISLIGLGISTSSYAMQPQNINEPDKHNFSVEESERYAKQFIDTLITDRSQEAIKIMKNLEKQFYYYDLYKEKSKLTSPEINPWKEYCQKQNNEILSLCENSNYHDDNIMQKMIQHFNLCINPLNRAIFHKGIYQKLHTITVKKI